MTRTCLCLLTGFVISFCYAVAAAAIENSPRPLPRPVEDHASIEVPAGSKSLIAAPLRPRARPGPPVAVLSTISPLPPEKFRPLPRPVGVTDIVRRAPAAAEPAAQKVVLRQDVPAGAVCGDAGVRGQMVGSIAGTRPGCGIANPVRVTSVSDVVLSRPAIMSCHTASALRYWVEASAKPAVGDLGGGLAQLNVAADYACRTRNHRPGAKISEHGKGRAIDISGIVMKDGTQFTLTNHWNTKGPGSILKKMHKGACGPFHTVLGPDADRYHKDHFHFDVRGGRPYCR
ncbi:MAG: extensin family protein [Pseudomonadota bacterium]